VRPLVEEEPASLLRGRAPAQLRPALDQLDGTPGTPGTREERCGGEPRQAAADHDHVAIVTCRRC